MHEDINANAWDRPAVASVLAYSLPQGMVPFADAPAGNVPLPPQPPIPAPPAVGRQDWDLLDTVAALRARQLSPVELIEQCLRRLEAVEPRIQAWVTVAADAARREARQAERWLRETANPSEQPLCGIPVAIKDIVYTRGLLTTGGSRATADFVPDTDAAVVTALKQAGAIIIGKTTTTEYALGDAPATRNPWHLEHTPGGSSSGSAAAVAAGVVPLAIGSQTGGSINRPAAYCGITGLMPTQALVKRTGVMTVSWTLDHVGPLARSARTVRYVLPVLAGAGTGAAPGAGTQAAPGGLPAPRGLRMGIPDRFFNQDTDPEVSAAVAAAQGVLAELGVIPVPVTLPRSFEIAQDAFQVILLSEAAAYHLAAFRRQAEQFGPHTAQRVTEGLTIPASAYVRALQVRQLYCAEMAGLLADVDFLVTPTTPTPAPPGIMSTGSFLFNSPFSMADMPALTLPAGFSRAGLPVGLQLIARPFGEALLLQVGEAFQQVTDWHLRQPAL